MRSGIMRAISTGPHVCSVFECLLHGVVLDRKSPFELHTRLYSNRRFDVMKENINPGQFLISPAHVQFNLGVWKDHVYSPENCCSEVKKSCSFKMSTERNAYEIFPSEGNI